MTFDERVNSLLGPIKSRWRQMPSERNRSRMSHHTSKGLEHINTYRQRLADGHRHRAAKHLRVAIAHLSRAIDRCKGEYNERDHD